MITAYTLIPSRATHAFRDSNDTAPYKLPSQTFNIEACGRDGRARLTVRVAGYWSSDVITVYIERKTHWLRGAEDAYNYVKWEATMGHSSGGRLTRLSDNYTAEDGYVALEDDLDAEYNFGHALIDAAAVARSILCETESLEHFYQIAKAEQDAARNAEKVARQAAIDADTPLGVEAAKRLIAEARATVTRSQSVGITMFERGESHPYRALCDKRQVITWILHGSRISEEKLIERLAASSNRTAIVN